ncbi:MAG: hypothetical protein HQL42_15470 [Alphaproteobacteria bacterium]|nr:hypothetical protein [Alphaproteobacteria bacterium]
MVVNQDHVAGAVAGLRKAAKQLGFYGDACVEAKLEIEGLASVWGRRGHQDEDLAEELSDLMAKDVMDGILVKISRILAEDEAGDDKALMNEWAVMADGSDDMAAKSGMTAHYGDRVVEADPVRRKYFVDMSFDAMAENSEEAVEKVKGVIGRNFTGGCLKLNSDQLCELVVLLSDIGCYEIIRVRREESVIDVSEN